MSMRKQRKKVGATGAPRRTNSLEEGFEISKAERRVSKKTFEKFTVQKQVHATLIQKPPSAHLKNSKGEQRKSAHASIFFWAAL